MLWIEKYRPVHFNEILGQHHAVSHLASFAETGTVPHLLLAGPHGTGKSTAVECLARGLYGDNWEENTTIIHVSDLFSLGKRYLEQDQRYAHLYRKELSLLGNFKLIVRDYASIRPLNAAFKLMVFEDGPTLTREAQQALRRIMERYSATCRFIFCTTQPGALIPAISSRCLPLFFSPIPVEVIAEHLRSIIREEQSPETSKDLDEIDLIAQASGGDLRQAILLLQAASQAGEGFDLDRLPVTESREVAAAAFSAAREGDLQTATRRIELLMTEYGLSGREVLLELRGVVKMEYNDPRIAVLLGQVDHLMIHSGSEYLQLNAIIARMAREVFG
ncbi:MAG: AAA family ATPase [Methanoregulaceae archaeon]|nr:AAA family ATPase [Methanoregulaceae archaeon]